MVIIETERLIIRRFRADDWQDFHEYISSPAVLEYEPYWDTSLEAAQRTTTRFADNDSFWAVELKSSGKMIGHVYFEQIQPFQFLTWNLGYIFNPQYYGNGYATEACKAVLKYGFENLGVHRVEARCNPDNHRSWRLMERLAMRREGYSLKSVTFKKDENGEPIWWDEYRYALLVDEWAGFDCKCSGIQGKI